jgi:hypothetical protein
VITRLATILDLACEGVLVFVKFEGVPTNVRGAPRFGESFDDPFAAVSGTCAILKYRKESSQGPWVEFMPRVKFDVVHVSKSVFDLSRDRQRVREQFGRMPVLQRYVCPRDLASAIEPNGAKKRGVCPRDMASQFEMEPIRRLPDFVEEILKRISEYMEDSPANAKVMVLTMGSADRNTLLGHMRERPYFKAKIGARMEVVCLWCGCCVVLWCHRWKT